MATWIRVSLVAACCTGMVSCVSVASLAPAPVDGRYVAVVNAVMAESAALSDTASQRAENAAAAVARWRRTDAESED